MPSPKYTSRNRHQPELALDDQAEPPQENHIAQQVPEIGMHEHRRHPLVRRQTFTEGQHPLLGVSLCKVAKKTPVLMTISPIVTKGK